MAAGNKSGEQATSVKRSIQLSYIPTDSGTEGLEPPTSRLQVEVTDIYTTGNRGPTGAPMGQNNRCLHKHGTQKDPGNKRKRTVSVLPLNYTPAGATGIEPVSLA